MVRNLKRLNNEATLEFHTKEMEMKLKKNTYVLKNEFLREAAFEFPSR